MSQNNPTDDSLIGRKLGDFILKEKLGEGGFGTVYKAEQTTLGREAAIKILRIRHRDDAEKIERFKREAKLASKLEHPYTAHIYAFGTESDGLMWIAMELIHGTTLDKLLKIQGALPLERFVPLLEKICEVVHTAHEYGIIHRDIKPANVMVISRAGRLLPKLLDFGIAKGFDQPNLKLFPLDNIKNNSSIDNESQSIADSPTESISEVLEIKNLTQEPKIISITQSADKLNTKNQLVHTRDSSLSFEFLDTKSIESINLANSQEQTQKFSQELQTIGAIGSPPYMSCEQWLNNAPISAQSDIYSLGVLSYEVLAGKRPFVEKSITDMSLAHLTKPVPSLGEGFPVDLDQVIAKAMAKQPQERFNTALEFANAFHQASEIKENKESLPQINKDLQESFLTKAPQPIAQAIANLSNARNFHQMREDLLGLSRLLIHYLAVLAMGAYQQISTTQEHQRQTIADLLKKLYQQDLTLEEWLNLTKELCSPFVKHLDAFPIPEIVTLFFALDGKPNQQLSKLFEPFLSTQEFFRRISIDSEEAKSLLIVKLAQMTELLTALSFLQEYKLVVTREDYTEELVGLGVKRISALTLRGETFPPSQVIVTDNSYHPIVKLSPLVKSAKPFPGSNEEIFFFVGRNRYGGHFISWPSGFELSDDELWQWINQNIFRLFETQVSSAVVERPPYLGLSPFTNNDVDLFYGRERETSVFVNRMYSQTLLAVVGPSGAGKSSFIQAGIIPKLSSEWLSVTMRPGSMPLSTLILQLTKAGLNQTITVKDIKSTPELLVKVLYKWMMEIGRKLLLVIDQLEELFSLCLDINERQSFSLALAQASYNVEDPIRIVLTLRDDFLIRAEELAGLRERLSSSLYLLATPNKDQLLRILVKPAQDCGYSFEDEQLSQEIVEDVISQSAALALLAFTAAKLWELRDRQFKRLRRKAYQAMGGVGGALAQHAEEMMNQMVAEEQNLVREIMRRLITSEKTRAVITRSELVQVLGQKIAAEKVLEKLVAARLLVAYEGDDTIERIEIIHEALLNAWPRLIKWQQEDVEGSRLRDQLQIATQQWEARGRPKGLLWRDEALIELELWQSRYKINLTEKEQAFAKASLTEAYRSKVRTRSLIIIAFLVLTIGATILFGQRNKIEDQLLKFLEEQGREELLKGDKERALIYLSEAYSRGSKTDSLKFMLTQALNLLEGKEPKILEGHNGQVKSVAFNSDTNKLASGATDNIAIIWSTNGEIIHKLTGHQGAVNSLAFVPNSEVLITGSNDQTIKFWNVSTAELLDTLNFDNPVQCVAISPDGKQFAVTCCDSEVKVFSLSNKQLMFSLKGHLGMVYTVAYSSDGQKLVTASQDKTAKVWQTTDGRLINTLASHDGSLTSASFSPDNKFILTTANDHKLRVWQTSTSELVNSLEVDSQQVYFADFSRDSQQIITIGHDQQIKVWETNSQRQLFTFKGHTSIVRMGKYSLDGKYLATASSDHTVRLWNLSLDKRPFSEITELINTKVSLKLVNEHVVSVKTQTPLDVSTPTTSTEILFVKIQQKANPLKLETFQFETVDTDKLGKIVSKRTSETSFYREDLGNGIFLDMVSIPGGSFMLGSPEGKGSPEEHPQVQVSIKPFFIGKLEITQDVWKAVMGTDPSYFKGGNLPVEMINWFDAMLFCERLSQQTGRSYRLPTETEWEYACRAGSTTEFSYGENISWKIVNYDGSVPFEQAEKGIFREKTVPVASLGFANAFGLFDMHGNVFEWCLDTGREDYKDWPKDGSSKETPYSNSRVLRGGSWYYPAIEARSAARASTNPSSKLKSAGLRVVYQP